MGIWIASEQLNSVFGWRDLNSTQLNPWHPKKILQWIMFLIILFLVFVPFMFNDIETSFIFFQKLIYKMATANNTARLAPASLGIYSCSDY